MDNCEFCNMLKEVKTLSNKTNVDIIVAIRKSQRTLDHLTSGYCDYTLAKYLPYINAIDAQLLLRNTTEVRCIKTPKDALNLLNDVIADNKLSSYKLGDALGVSHQTVLRIMDGGAIRLSVFLKLAEVFNYSVCIEPLNIAYGDE